MTAPRLLLAGVVAEDTTEYVDLEHGDGTLERVPAGPRRLEVRLKLTVLNPSDEVFATLRKLIGPVTLTATPADHPGL